MARRLAFSLLLVFMMLVLPATYQRRKVTDLVSTGVPPVGAQVEKGGGDIVQEKEAASDEVKGVGGARIFVRGAAKTAGFDTKQTSPTTVAGALVNTFLSLIGIVFIILIIYAGFKWMTAGGNEEQVNKAKTTIINSVIGIVVVMGAFVIYKFIEGIL